MKRVTYTVPSRLIGEQLRVLIYQHSIECYLGSIKVFESERKIAPRKGNARVIDYKHIISSLHKKPQAFRYSQIRDDILDVTGETAKTGKSTQADAARNQPTFPALIGLEASQERAEELMARAIKALGELSGDTAPLAWLAKYIIQRDH